MGTKATFWFLARRSRENARIDAASVITHSGPAALGPSCIVTQLYCGIDTWYSLGVFCYGTCTASCRSHKSVVSYLVGRRLLLQGVSSSPPLQNQVPSRARERKSLRKFFPLSLHYKRTVTLTILVCLTSRSLFRPQCRRGFEGALKPAAFTPLIPGFILASDTNRQSAEVSPPS